MWPTTISSLWKCAVLHSFYFLLLFDYYWVVVTMNCFGRRTPKTEFNFDKHRLFVLFVRLFFFCISVTIVAVVLLMPFLMCRMVCNRKINQPASSNNTQGGDHWPLNRYCVELVIHKKAHFKREKREHVFSYVNNYVRFVNMHAYRRT